MAKLYFGKKWPFVFKGLSRGEKQAKLLLYFSLVPYLFILLLSIFRAFSGIEFFMGSMVYGFDAFILSMFLCLYVGFFVVPILSICFIYQIAYLFRKKIKPFKKIKLKNYIIIFVIVGIVVVGALLLSYHSYSIKNYFNGVSARRMYKASELKIPYNNEEDMVNSIYDIDVKSNHLLVDFDKMEIGFLTYSGIDDFYKVKLEKQEEKELFNKIIKDYFFQAEIKLEGEADRLLTFSKEGVYAFDSIAYIMVMSNGEMYAYLDDEEEFNELNSSVYYVGENTKFN